jgi:hypothetical protein
MLSLYTYLITLESPIFLSIFSPMQLMLMHLEVDFDLLYCVCVCVKRSEILIVRLDDDNYLMAL